MATLARARRIAAEAHAGQTDKAGAPFLTHVERVAARVEGETGKTVALLHDVVEKGPGWTLARLSDEGFSPEILAAVDAMTRREGEDYFAFARRAAANPLAYRVKIADLSDNIERSQRPDASAEDLDRVERYAAALAMITRG